MEWTVTSWMVGRETVAGIVLKQKEKKICQAPYYGTETMAVNLTESRVFLGTLQGVPGSDGGRTASHAQDGGNLHFSG